MGQIKYAKILIVLLLFSVGNRVVYAADTSTEVQTETSSQGTGTYTLDNDGNARTNPYGDCGLPSSYQGVEYYDCYVPYNLTPADIGGYSTNVLAYTTKKYDYSMQSYYPQRINNKFAYLVNGYKPMPSVWNGASVSVESGTNLQIATDKNGAQYYMTAIQKFFYNAQKPGFPQWNEQNGQLVDVILTDGNVIHFVVVDANAHEHTNGGPPETKLWNVIYEFSPMKNNTYKNLFHAAYGNMPEISGTSWGAGVNEFMKKYGLSLDGNMIAYYRMYDANISNPPKRNPSAGNGVSTNVGNVTFAGSREDGLGSSRMVSEFELEGMSKYKDKISDNAGIIDLPDQNSLTLGEKVSISTIKEDKVDKLTAFLEGVRVVIAAVGLLLLLYIVLLWAAFAFDYSNICFEVSFLFLLTFGRLHRDKCDKNSNVKVLVKDSIVLFLTGSLLLSGVVYRCIQFIFNFITGSFS